MNAPGLSILCRESFHRGEDAFDRPLSSRFDEGDAILMFDRVLVPHERMIIDGDLEAYNGMLSARPGYTPLQATIRSTMKLRFLAGVATAIARANGRDKLPRFQAAIGELIALVSVAEGIRAGAIAEGLRRAEAFARGEFRIEGDGLSEPKTIGVCGGAAINFFFPYANTKAADVLRLAAGSGVLAMTGADYAHPEVGPLMDKWLIGPGIDAKRRLRAHEARLGHDRQRIRLARRALRTPLLGRSRDQRAALVQERDHQGMRAARARIAEAVTVGAPRAGR